MRDEIAGKRFAVAGLGVSGIAAASALHKLGGKVLALDQKPSAGPLMLAAESLMSQGIEVVTGWHGRLDRDEHDWLIASPGFPKGHPALADMAGKVWGEIELGYRIAKAPILAITGTNGKSTTTVLAWQFLVAEGVDALLCGNISGSGYPERVFTTAAFEADESQVLVAEISSFQLENTLTFRPKAACITNITPDHLDRHPAFEDYRDAKLSMLDHMGERDWIIKTPAPLPTLEQIRAKAPLSTVVQFDLATGGSGEGSLRLAEGCLRLGDCSLALGDLPIQGEHFLANVLAAWELASRFATLTTKSLNVIKNFGGLSHRLELIGEKGGVRVVNNSMCTNPAAAAASIASIRGRQHLLIGGKTKGMTAEDYAPFIEAARSHACYFYGLEAENLHQWFGGSHAVHSSMLEAFAAAAKEAASGEVIHLSPGCASSEPYANFRERGEAFKKAAKEWLST